MTLQQILLDYPPDNKVWYDYENKTENTYVNFNKGAFDWLEIEGVVMVATDDDIYIMTEALENFKEIEPEVINDYYDYYGVNRLDFI